VIWAVGVLTYVVTVMQRTTLGASGLDAAARFHISPGALSAFVFIQVVVYMAAQIPAGLMVDRWGSRVMLTVAAILLSAGQFALSVTSALAPAVLARVLVGMGDAIVFVGVLALVPRWFPARRVPLLTQLTTITGQIGQVLSAVPFLALLHAVGWTPAFAAAGAVSVFAGLLVLVAVRNAPAGRWTAAPSASAAQLAGQVRAVWARPGTRLGFFSHLGTQFPMMVFALLWGIPYLVDGQHQSAGRAGALVALFVVCSIGIGPVIGVLTTRHPLRRSWLVLTVIGANVCVWTAVLALPGPAPGWLLVVLVVVLSAGGPGSVVGIDIGRTSNPGPNLGLAQSMVNLGGFSATLVVLATMGIVMTAQGGFTPGAFRLAWLVQYPVWAFAVAGILITRRRARSDAAHVDGAQAAELERDVAAGDDGHRRGHPAGEHHLPGPELLALGGQLAGQPRH
jgi:nitrate/nitrite transporter NarK